MLNPTDEKFLQATLRGATPEEAAIAAGLSVKTARVSGARLRKKPAIVEALAVIGIASPGAPSPLPAATRAEPEPEDEPLDDLPQTSDSLEFLEAVQANPRVPLGRRIEVAKALLPFQHAKIGEKGKKENRLDAAKEIEKGKYGTAPAPLRSVK